MESESCYSFPTANVSEICKVLLIINSVGIKLHHPKNITQIQVTRHPQYKLETEFSGTGDPCFPSCNCLGIPFGFQISGQH